MSDQLQDSRISRQPLEVVGESFSPWTKKARWAIEQCDVDYTYREYTPTLSEAGLRWRLRQWSGYVSVPIAFAGPDVLRGSWDIACYANAASGHERLGDMASIARWDQLSEAALAEGRTRVVRAILRNDAALEECLPRVVPSTLRRPLRFIARDAVGRLDRKYAHLYEAGAIRRALTALREALDRSHTGYVQGDFGYADITMAVVLEVVAPIARAEPPLGPETHACWHDAALAAEFDDLVRWRLALAASPITSYSQFTRPDD